MNAIRMVWIISRHYNRDERMVPLMERIAWELANKVANIVNVKTILRKPPMESKKIIMDAKNLLEAWSKVIHSSPILSTGIGLLLNGDISRCTFK
jgi:dynein heavy chain